MTSKRRSAISILSVGLCLFLAGPVLAEELPDIEEGCGTQATRGYGGCVGYEGLTIDGGGETILPFMNLESHPVLKAQYHEPVGAGLLDISLDFNGSDYHSFKADYYGVSASAGMLSQKFPRNLEHLSLPGPFDTSTSPLFWSEDTDPGEEYGVDLAEQEAFVKYKLSTYPANASLAVRRFQVEGEKQQFILNENCTTSCHSVSETRKVRTTTDQVMLDGSAHVGLVDISYRYKGTQFADDEADPVFNYDSVLGFTGTQSHNIYPDTEAAEHTFNVSTNHTGRYAGFLGLTVGERENKESDISEKFQNLMGRFLWRPNERLSLLLDSRQLFRQDDTPGATVASERLSDGAPLRYGSVLNCSRATVNYYFSEQVDLQGMVKLTSTEREDNELWGLPDETTANEMRVIARIKPVSGLKVNASWLEKNVDDPSYRSSPTDSRKMAVSGRWVPLAGVSLSADVKDLRDENCDSGLVNERRLLGAGVTYTPQAPVTLTLLYYQFDNDITSDLTFADSVPSISEDDVPYNAEGAQYVLQAIWNAGKALQVKGQYSYLQAEGGYEVGGTGGFSDAGDYSGLDAIQQESSLDVLYTMEGGWGLAARLASLSYEDKESGLEDEKVDHVSASVTKRW